MSEAEIPLSLAKDRCRSASGPPHQVSPGQPTLSRVDCPAPTFYPRVGCPPSFSDPLRN